MSNKRPNKTTIFFSTTLVGLIIAVWCCQTGAHPFITRIPGLNNKQVHAPGLNQDVLNLAVRAYENAKSTGLGFNEHLTIVDYSLPSTTPRMWVINMQTRMVVHVTHVAHGIGSGDNYAHKFSNKPGSYMSSLGLFLTGDIYKGKYGDSLQLHGLDGKFNSNAFSRRIVMHQANYVDEHVINKIGRLGRSFGCLALNKKVANNVMKTIKGGSLVFCYYPDKAWLSESTMLRT